MNPLISLLEQHFRASRELVEQYEKLHGRSENARSWLWFEEITIAYAKRLCDGPTFTTNLKKTKKEISDPSSILNFDRNVKSNVYRLEEYR